MNKKLVPFILGLVERNPGKLDWHAVERRVTLDKDFDIGFDELIALLKSLVKDGFMDARKDEGSDLPPGYWITEKGKNVLATEPRKVS